mmetsp:Transcript_17539/g.45158  ORF Transcript_17539/g.45158 Transcript_17539/m.45158 type:complete len:392 (-) Transcript_17539:2-1177(-)
MRNQRLRPLGDKAGDADSDDVAGHGLLDRLPRHALHDGDVLHLAAAHQLARQGLGDNLVSLRDVAAEDLASDGGPQARQLVHLRHEHGEAAALLIGRQHGLVRHNGRRRRHRVADGLEESHHVRRPAIGPSLLQRARAEPSLARRVEGGILELVVACGHGGEDVKDIVLNLARLAHQRPVDLVDHDHGLHLGVQQGLLQHELRLRLWPLNRINQEHDTIHHGEHALDLAAEVRVAWRVDDVERVAVPRHTRRLGQDRDATLLLQVLAVQHALCDLNSHATLLHQAVHQCGFAVIDVRDDGHVPDLFQLRGLHDAGRAAHADSGEDRRLGIGEGPVRVATRVSSPRSGSQPSRSRPASQACGPPQRRGKAPWPHGSARAWRRTRPERARRLA